METAVDDIIAGRYKMQHIKPVQARIVTPRNEFTRIGLNEILVRGQFSHVSQFSVSIDETKVQDFSLFREIFLIIHGQGIIYILDETFVHVFDPRKIDFFAHGNDHGIFDHEHV